MTAAEDFARLVADLPHEIPRAALDEVRAELPRPTRETVDGLADQALRDRPDARLTELVASYRRGDAPASLVLAHPSIRAVVRRRTDELS